FPELDAEAREALLRRHYRVTGQAAMDLGLIWWGSRRRLERLVTFIGMEPVLERLERGENIIVLTGHFVGADFGGIYSSRNTDGIVMMKEMPNELFNWFVWRGRTRFGAEVTLRRDGLRPLLKALRNHRPCYYVPDEDFGPEISVFVPFFGIPTATITTLGRLAAAARAVVVPCWTRLQPDGRYEIEFGAAFEDYPSGNEEADAARMSLAIEEGIRKAPEQYMWTLKWFRSRPGGEPPPYDRPAP
ncbi:MAG: lysophospholipid acyltransferase family protein, partial [Hyphomicrobiales bacterium]